MPILIYVAIWGAVFGLLSPDAHHPLDEA